MSITVIYDGMSPTVLYCTLFSSVDQRYPIHLYHYDVIWCRKLYFPDVGLSTKRQNMGEEKSYK